MCYARGIIMNIQIYGKSKCFDTKKAERYFKERRIKYQLIDLGKYGMSLGEYKSVKTAVGGMKKLMNENSREYEENYVKYLSEDADKEEKLLEHPGMFQTPIVRNGRQATVGYQPDVWKEWV
jgi:arsenate reductase-like glutaredoxin family protein